MTPQPSGVCVFAPSTFTTVTAEAGPHGDEIHFHAGGQGFWIARLLGRLGVPTMLHTALGGESGIVARALLGKQPIDVRAVGTTQSSGSWMHDRRSGAREEIANDIGQRLDRHAVDELYGATLAASLGAGICVLAGPHHPEMIDAEIYERLARDLRRNGVTVVADLSREHLRAALAGGLDFCKVSDSDLAETDGLDHRGDTGDVLRRLADAGSLNVTVTRAERPLVAFVDGELFEVSTPHLEAVDHRGAGDAFTALVAACRFWGLTWRESIEWGAAAGALSVTRRGLATADRREIHHMVGLVEARPLSRDD